MEDFLLRIKEREKLTKEERQRQNDPVAYFDRLKKIKLNKDIENCICNGALDKAIMEKQRGNDSDPYFTFDCQVDQLFVPKLTLSSHLPEKVRNCLPPDSRVFTSGKGHKIIVAFDNPFLTSPLSD
jgi:hypothetical protein